MANIITSAVAGVLAAALGTAAAGAAEIKMLVTNSLKTTLEELAPQFEKASEHKLAITFGATSELKTAIEKGATFDVAILTPVAIDDLAKLNKVAAEKAVPIARAPFGMAVRKGAPKPDISTIEAFKRALLAAKSVGYVAAGAGSPYFTGLLDKFGIADQMKPKLVALPTSNPAAHAVANGEAEIGVTAISEILPYAGAEVAGPLPEEIQFYSVSTAALAPDTKVAAAARSAISFLTAPAAAAVLKSKGLNPG
jgi:molybdate transport system substrate-binding protein